MAAGERLERRRFMMLGADADVRHAEALCTRALELDPGYLRALLRRARARLALRKSTLAFADLRDLLSRKVCTQSTPAASRTIVDEARALLAAPAANAGAYASARAFPRGKAPPQHAARGWGAPPTARGRACAQAAPKAPPRAWWLIDDVSQRVVAWGRGRTLGQLLIDLPRLIPGTPAVVQPLVPGKVRLAYLHAAKALHPDKVRADAPDLVLRKEAFLLLKDLYERENQ
ncbi:hypothetical protein M885DRAFT_9495 [Pelagophyceae sp. CCMP2097]|nr:hypothetical protein M885DRAFT_9495 [Pelagophyceae sp. CCMP2097]